MPDIASLSDSYGTMLKAQADALIHLHFNQMMPHAYVAPQSGVTPVPDPAQKAEPAFVVAHYTTRTVYGFSDVQDALIRERLSFANPDNSYHIYNDRMFNALGAFFSNWMEDEDDPDILAMMKEENIKQCRHALDDTSPLPYDTTSVQIDDQTYYETTYRSMVTGVACLSIHRRLVEYNTIETVADHKANLVDYLRQQEQLALNCTNLFYLYYDNFAAENDVEIAAKTKPEFPLIYPARLPR